jgi:hypothetical protein
MGSNSILGLKIFLFCSRGIIAWEHLVGRLHNSLIVWYDHTVDISV